VFCAVLPWSRWRFVRFALDESQATTLAMLAECFEMLGGVPAVVLAPHAGNACSPSLSARPTTTIDAVGSSPHRRREMIPARDVFGTRVRIPANPITHSGVFDHPPSEAAERPT